MPSQKDRSEYYRQRRERLQQDPEWLEKEAARKAAWYAQGKKAKPAKKKLTEAQKKKRRQEYDQKRRKEISDNPELHEAEKKRKLEWYHKNKKS